jgi:hypothetical protein
MEEQKKSTKKLENTIEFVSNVIETMIAKVKAILSSILSTCTELARSAMKVVSALKMNVSVHFTVPYIIHRCSKIISYAFTMMNILRVVMV